jgi:hypothetical protein
MHVPHGRPPSWKASPHPSLVLFSCLFFNPAAEEKVIKKSPCVILRSAMTSATLNDMWVAWGDLILCHARWEDDSCACSPHFSTDVWALPADS